MLDIEEFSLAAWQIPNPNALTIGRFTICRSADNSLWIRCADGEGMQVPDEAFEAALAEFYAKHF